MSCLPPRVRSHVTAAMAVALCLAVVSSTMASAMASESTTPGPGQPGSALPAKAPAQTLPAKAPAEALVAKAPAETLAKALAAGQLVVPAGAAEQTADLRRRRLLAVIAAICMFGVTTAIIRAIVSQRTRRTVKG